MYSKLLIAEANEALKVMYYRKRSRHVFSLCVLVTGRMYMYVQQRFDKAYIYVSTYVQHFRFDKLVSCQLERFFHFKDIPSALLSNNFLEKCLSDVIISESNSKQQWRALFSQ